LSIQSLALIYVEAKRLRPSVPLKVRLGVLQRGIYSEQSGRHAQWVIPFLAERQPSDLILRTDGQEVRHSLNDQTLAGWDGKESAAELG
jgi:hypothetical protein